MAVAKGIGGGFPLGAVLATKEAAKGMVAGTHGSTFGGNPLGTAVADAVIETILEPGFLDGVQRKALLFKQQLAYLKDAYPHIIEEVRGSGLLMGLKVKPPQGEVIAAFLEEKLLTVAAGDNVVRLLPPLNVTDDEIGAAVSRISHALARLPQPA
jgi:acetylornithine/N-succinyldiaminopimelate aminotransferase